MHHASCRSQPHQRPPAFCCTMQDSASYEVRGSSALEKMRAGPLTILQVISSYEVRGSSALENVRAGPLTILQVMRCEIVRRWKKVRAGPLTILTPL